MVGRAMALLGGCRGRRLTLPASLVFLRRPLLLTAAAAQRDTSSSRHNRATSTLDRASTSTASRSEILSPLSVVLAVVLSSRLWRRVEGDGNVIAGVWWAGVGPGMASCAWEENNTLSECSCL